MGLHRSASSTLGHAVGGWAAAATPFASQFIGAIAVCNVRSFDKPKIDDPACFVLFQAVKVTIGLRVSAQEELEGPDQ